MEKLRICMLLILILCCGIKLKAGQGCLIGGKIYYGQTGTTLLGKYLYDPNLSYDVYSGICSPGDYAIYASQTTQEKTLGFAIDCGYTGDIDLNPSRGKVWNFDEVQCPLDDYIPFLLLVTGGLGYCSLRKKCFIDEWAT
jgi:hypothetical protein